MPFALAVLDFVRSEGQKIIWIVWAPRHRGIFERQRRTHSGWILAEGIAVVAVGWRLGPGWKEPEERTPSDPDELVAKGNT